MPTIKFSHKYNKLRKKYLFATTAILLDVISVELSQLSQEFLAYDTDYGTFKLPESGKYMMLIFLKDRENIFTTLRKYSDEKEKHYRENIGKEFDIEYVTPRNGESYSIMKCINGPYKCSRIGFSGGKECCGYLLAIGETKFINLEGTINEPCPLPTGEIKCHR